MEAEKTPYSSTPFEEFLKRDDPLRREVERYYLPHNIVGAIHRQGEIPQEAKETLMGIGFLGIDRYAFISKFLSPKENHRVLNGLYSCFDLVLKKQGGYLSRLEGDTIMFHFGGPLDYHISSLSLRPGEEEVPIAKELFNTCLDLQRSCALFNREDEGLLYALPEGEAKNCIAAAYESMAKLRKDKFLGSTMKAMLQIRVRVGASIGRVLAGNFGPEGRKQWDVIGLPVIEAKALETSAPVDGVRISKNLYDLLEKEGVVDNYYTDFLREATLQKSSYSSLQKKELLTYETVVLEETLGRTLETYSIQVEPNLPANIINQTRYLLKKGDLGADRIIGFLDCYRDNKYVIEAFEELFDEEGIIVKKEELIKLLFPRYYSQVLEKWGHYQTAAIKALREEYSLGEVLQELSRILSSLELGEELKEEGGMDFPGYELYLQERQETLTSRFEEQRELLGQKSYFYRYVFPLFMSHLKASILEYQATLIEDEPENEESQEEDSDELENPDETEESSQEERDEEFLQGGLFET